MSNEPVSIEQALECFKTQILPALDEDDRAWLAKLFAKELLKNIDVAYYAYYAGCLKILGHSIGA